MYSCLELLCKIMKYMMPNMSLNLPWVVQLDYNCQKVNKIQQQNPKHISMAKQRLLVHKNMFNLPESGVQFNDWRKCTSRENVGTFQIHWVQITWDRLKKFSVSTLHETPICVTQPKKCWLLSEPDLRHMFHVSRSERTKTVHRESTFTQIE